MPIAALIMFVMLQLAGCTASRHPYSAPGSLVTRGQITLAPATTRQTRLPAPPAPATTRQTRLPAPLVPATTRQTQIAGRSRAAGSVPAKPGSPTLAPVTAAYLTLSIPAGPAGTNVLVTATGCPPPDGGYRAFFADSQALGNPQDPAYRHLFTVRATGAGDVEGAYRIGGDDTAGFGLFEIQCGAATNAVATFNVTGI